MWTVSLHTVSVSGGCCSHGHTYLCVHTCLHTQTHTHNTCTHRHTQACTHTHAHTCIHTRTQTHTPTTHACTHTHIHTNAHTHTHVHTHTCAHTPIEKEKLSLLRSLGNPCKTPTLLPQVISGPEAKGYRWGSMGLNTNEFCPGSGSMWKERRGHLAQGLSLRGTRIWPHFKVHTACGVQLRSGV